MTHPVDTVSHPFGPIHVTVDHGRVDVTVFGTGAFDRDRNGPYYDLTETRIYAGTIEDESDAQGPDLWTILSARARDAIESETATQLSRIPPEEAPFD